MFKLVDESGLKDSDRKYLSDLYIAQFSGWKYVFLLLNCMHYKKENKFRELVIKYKVFEHMSDKRISKFDRIIEKDEGFVAFPKFVIRIINLEDRMSIVDDWQK